MRPTIVWALIPRPNAERFPGRARVRRRSTPLALVEATALTVADGGPTPASRINPATPKHCLVLGHIDSVSPQAPPIWFQTTIFSWLVTCVAVFIPVPS